MNRRIVKLITFGTLLGTLSACESGADEVKPAYNRNKTLIYADESFQPFMKTAGETYEGRYPDMHISFEYVSETAALNALIKDETKTAFVTRDFSVAEKKRLRKSHILVNSTIIAKDAVVLIVNDQCTDTTFTLSQLKDILTGTKTTWPATQKTVNVIFDRVQSANFNQLSNLIDRKPFGKNIFALKSNLEVVEYVKAHPDAMGVIGYNWLSDLEDPKIQAIRKNLKIVRIARTSGEKYWEPYFLTIDRNAYPLTRNLWAINKGASDGLNASFINFLEGDLGQRLIDKAGLIPHRKTERQLNFTFE